MISAIQPIVFKLSSIGRAALEPEDAALCCNKWASMAEEDMQIGRRKLSRIDVIREKLADFIRGRQ
ncbi:MAG: hypothetical protein AAFP68_06690, partial [Pseudomonadota bacterium]